MNIEILPQVKEDLAQVKEDLETLKKTCIEAQNGTWDKSDDGFNDMFYLLARVQHNLNIVDTVDYDALLDDNDNE